MIIRKFVSKNAYPVRKKVGFTVDHEVLQNGDLPLSARKGGSEEPTTDVVIRNGEDRAGLSGIDNDFFLPDMNPKPAGFKERRLHSIEMIQQNREEQIPPMIMPTLKLLNKQ